MTKRKIMEGPALTVKVFRKCTASPWDEKLTQSMASTVTPAQLRISSRAMY